MEIEEKLELLDHSKETFVRLFNKKAFFSHACLCALALIAWIFLVDANHFKSFTV